MWKKMLLKRIALLLVAGAVALTGPRSGLTQGPCEVERGQQPLDVLTQAVRHNVWLLVDDSGSMRGDFGGEDKYEAAARIIRMLMEELVDASGQPLVNWAYAVYDDNDWRESQNCNQPDGPDDDTYPDEPSNCHGLKDDAYVEPSPCGGDTREQILEELEELGQGNGTPIGIGFDDLSNYILGSNPANLSGTNFVDTLLPGQKNYIIHLTDGEESCECPAEGYDLPGLDRVPMRGGHASPDVTFLGGGNDSWGGYIAAYNAGLKGELALRRIDPDLDGSKGNIFVIGVDLDEDDWPLFEHIAWVSSGASIPGRRRSLMYPAFFAGNPDELADAFREVVALIGVPDTEVTLGTSLVGTVKELIPQIPGLEIEDPVTNALRAATPDDIIGDLNDLDDVNHARVLRSKLRDNVLFTTSVETPGFMGHLRAYNVYRVQDFDTGTETRPLDLIAGTQQFTTQFWDAGELLRDRHPDDRTILFNRRGAPPGAAPEEFTVANVSAADLGVSAGYLSEIDGLGAHCDADAAEMVVNVIRGYRLVIDPVHGLYEDGIRNCHGLRWTDLEDGLPTWKLLDPSNVGPTVVQNPPRSPDNNPLQFHRDEYGNRSTFPDGFYWENLNRQTVVYLPTNGGMIHAFRADSGGELFAYIPADVLGDWADGEIPDSRNTLKDLVELIVANTNGISNHRFFLASSATVEDVFLNASEGGDDEWHTMLAFGRGAGGKFLTALDVSDVGDWDGNRNNMDHLTDAARFPELRFNVGNRQGIVDTDASGLSYDGLGETWSIPVMGNVRSSANDDQWVMFAGAGYGCRDPATNEGQFLYILKMEDGSMVTAPFQIPNDDTAAIDYNALVATPALYNATQLDPLSFHDLTTRVYIGDLQGYVYKLDCSQPDPLNWTFEQFADLGRDQPITAAAAIMKDWFFAQTVYVFVGTGGDERVSTDTTQFMLAGFVDQDADGANSPGQPIQVTAGDFVIVLPEGERIHVAPVIGGQSVFFASTQRSFSNESCAYEYTSTLYELGVTTGLGTFDLDTEMAGEQSALELEGKVTGLFFRDDHLYVSQSGGVDTQGDTLVIGRGEIPSDQGELPGTIQLTVRGFRLSPF